MKTFYDPGTDAMFLRFSEDEIIESEERIPGMIFDFDKDGRLVGIEILDATEKLSKGLDLTKIATAA